jgi:hypothetical protein
LVTTVLTLTISVSGSEVSVGIVETEETAVAAFLPGTAISVGQSLSSAARGGPGGDGMAESDGPAASLTGVVPAAIARWQRLVLGLDEALEKFQKDNPNGVSAAPARDSVVPDQSSHPAARDSSPVGDRSDASPGAEIPSQAGPTSSNSGPNQIPGAGERGATENARPSASAAEAVDAMIESVWGVAEICSLSAGPCLLSWAQREFSTATSRPFALNHKTDQNSRRSEQRTTDNEPRMANNGLLAPSLLVATMSMQWVHASRRHQTGRTGWSGRIARTARGDVQKRFLARTAHSQSVETP